MLRAPNGPDRKGLFQCRRIFCAGSRATCAICALFLSEAQEPSFKPTEYTLRTSDGWSDAKARWKVRVGPDGHKIIRHVWCDDVPWDRCGIEWKPEEVVWPAWPGGIDEESTSPASPLAGLQDYWSTVGNRLRDSAKWMAAVLGGCAVPADRSRRVGPAGKPVSQRAAGSAR